MITTDQKDIIFKEVSRYVKKYKIRSILDIGAGDGALAKKISTKVREYLAVEKDKKRVANLKKLGLKVVQGVFPIDVNKKFDMVLASHSMPESPRLYKKFFEKSLSLLNNGGVLLIVTFKGQLGELHNLRKKWRGENYSKNQDTELYHLMLNILKNYGDTEVHRARSSFQSKNLEEIVQLALKSIGPKTSKRKSCKLFLENFFKTKHFSSGVYKFPHEHVFIVTKRSPIKRIR